MVVDSSAIVAVLNGEAGWPAIQRVIEQADEVRMSAVTVFECRIVLLRLSRLDLFARFLRRAAITIDSFDADQAELASAAYQRFGRGSGHPARLNMGDCAAYALAKSLDLPLLYKGDDFAHTDIRPAL